MAAVNFNVSIDEKDYLQAKAFFAALNTDLESVFKEFLAQAVEYDRVPEFIQAAHNAETLESMQEMEDIISGKIPAKRYDSVEEMNAALDAEDDEI